MSNSRSSGRSNSRSSGRSNSRSSGSIVITKPNKHPINKKNLLLWLDNCDKSIKSIANEFILKTTYISYALFIKYYKKAINEMLSILKTNSLQFFVISEDENKSSFWIMQIIRKYVNTKKYNITVVTNISDINKDIPVIIPDDASYSGSQIYNLLESFENNKYDIFILIPFISNTAIDIIKSGFNEYNIDGSLYFLNNAKYIMKPIYELMSEEKIQKLFIYYTTSPNVREYPIYFDHKVADNYSSFPLIYTYGIIPNNHNKNIIHTCKKNRIPIKKHFSEFERIPLLKNCNLDIEYNIGTPPCPLQPYKKSFTRMSNSSVSKRKKKSPSSI